MGDNLVVNGAVMGAAGAGIGYAAAAHQTAAITKEATTIVKRNAELVKQFEKYGGYQEGMNIGQAAFNKVQLAIKKGWMEHGISSSVTKKALDRIWNKAMKKLPKMVEEMGKIKEALPEATKKLADIKALKNKYMLVGAGAGLGLYILNRIRKAIFAPKTQA